jgi:DnaA family protein
LKQKALDIGIRVTPDFSNYFVSDASTHGVVKYLQDSVLSFPDQRDLPAYLWGPIGSGKTHLLLATYAALQKKGVSVAWLDPSNKLASAFDSDWNVVIFHDVHRYTKDQQQIAFNWFVNAQTERCWVLACGDTAPGRLALREDLRTRLAWGDVFELAIPKEEESRLILKQLAQQYGIVLREDVLNFILRRFSRDLGSLTELLQHLDQWALEHKRLVTIPLVKKMLKEM